MKKKTKIALVVIFAIVALIAALGFWQRDNIRAFVDSLKYSEEQITQKLDDNTKKMQEIVEKTDYINIRGALTPEEEAALASGEISDLDAMKLVKGETTLEEIRAAKTQSEQVPQPESASEKPQTEEKPQTPSALVQAQPEQKPKKKTPAEIMEEEVSNIVAQLYVEKSSFVSQLEGLANDAAAQYSASGGGKEKTTEIVNAYLPKATELEKTCDAKVAALLTKLENSLKKGGGDLALVDEVRQFYYKEKGLKKSYYLSKIYG